MTKVFEFWPPFNISVITKLIFRIAYLPALLSEYAIHNESRVIATLHKVAPKNIQLKSNLHIEVLHCMHLER